MRRIGSSHWKYYRLCIFNIKFEREHQGMKTCSFCRSRTFKRKLLKKKRQTIKRHQAIMGKKTMRRRGERRKTKKEKFYKKPLKIPISKLNIKSILPCCCCRVTSFHSKFIFKRRCRFR